MCDVKPNPCQYSQRETFDRVGCLCVVCVVSCQSVIGVPARDLNANSAHVPLCHTHKPSCTLLRRDDDGTDRLTTATRWAQQTMKPLDSIMQFAVNERAQHCMCVMFRSLPIICMHHVTELRRASRSCHSICRAHLKHYGHRTNTPQRPLCSYANEASHIRPDQTNHPHTRFL